MTPSFQEPAHLIQLSVTARLPSAGRLVIEFHAAPEKPGLGSAPAQVGEVALAIQPEQPHTALVSLGKEERITPEILRQAGGGLARWLIKTAIVEAQIDLDPLIARGDDYAAALLEGMLLGAYQFSRYKSSPETPDSISIQLVSSQAGWKEKVEKIQKVCAAIFLARDWSHEPANVINPVTLAERLIALAEADQLTIKVMDEALLAQMGAGGILNVGKGSASQPRMIVLEYAGQDPAPDARPVILIGKAITFDTGGYSLKSTENIRGMKYDKCGGMTVAAMIHLASQMKLKNPVIGIIAAAENMVSGEAYRPDDIIHMLSGKTVEIISTDAEGRLVLADALTYAQKTYHPYAMIDLATLTGGVVVALGHVRAGLMANNDSLANALFDCGKNTHERLWRLPLDEDFDRLIKGDDADIKNSGGREGHAILGGIFLKQFVNDQVPWAHLDIAGMAETEKDLPYCPKGATGFGIRLLLEYLENR